MNKKIDCFTPPSNNYHNFFSTSNLISEDFRNGIVLRAPNWLGDAVMSLPAIYNLQKIVPAGCKIYILCPDKLKALFGNLKEVEKVIGLGDGHISWSKEILKEVSDLNAGVGFLFVNSFRSAYYMKRAGIKKLYGASNGIRNLFLSRSFKLPKPRKRQYSFIHQSYKNLAMTVALGAPEWNGSLPEFNILKHLEIKNPDIKQLKKSDNLLLIHPGAAYGLAKRWPAKHFGAVCNYWNKKYKGKIIVVGSKAEQDTAQKVIEYSDLASDQIVDLCGKSSLNELMYISKISQICLCNDSGVMHLASVLNPNGIAIFGSTDPYSTGPLGEFWTVLLEKQNCSPCFSRECKNENKDYRCLKNITPEKVNFTLDKYWQANLLNI